MADTTGKKLSQARLARGLTVDEVAFATKLRPDKVLALEHDDYSRFPNNAYVKGFLQIYGRYLEVDVRATVMELENANPVSVSDYQYLNHAPEAEPERVSVRRQSKRPSLAPLIVFLFLCFVVGTGGFLYISAQRLGDLDEISKDKTGASGESAAGSGTLPAATPAPVPPTATTPSEPAPAAVIQANSVAALSDREFIKQPASAVDSAPAEINEVVLQPLRKTWVKVCRDDPNSTPIFEDYLYTSAPPLKLRGARFFIEVRDEGAVTIRKNGATIAYQSPGITVQ